jgi:hypothetical protein
MVVAVIALIVALSGTAIAAVDFARNAGAVDGKSAVGAKASLRSAAGKLVATSTGGNGKGQIPARFLDGVMRGGTMTLSKYLRTVDNQAGRPTPLLIIPGIGRFDAQCDDVDPTAGTQTTRTSITFTASVKRRQRLAPARARHRRRRAAQRLQRAEGSAGVDPGQRRRALRAHHGGQGALGPHHRRVAHGQRPRPTGGVPDLGHRLQGRLSSSARSTSARGRARPRSRAEADEAPPTSSLPQRPRRSALA